MADNTKKKQASGFSDEERAAMKEYANEKKGGGEGEAAVLGKIAAMSDPDRTIAKQVHEIVKKAAPSLTPKTWYGMPAYANAEGKVVCFFQNAGKFKARYQLLGFNDAAKLDDGNMWPTSYAINKLTPADEKNIAALVRKAVG